MFSYLIKRLSIMAVTLMGIIVITFVISRMTPGDPALLSMPPEGGRASEGLTDEYIRETRRTMGLDRPMLFNFHGEDRFWHARDTLDRYQKTTGFWRENARFELGEINTIAVFDAIERFEKETDLHRRRDLAALLPALARIPESQTADFSTTQSVAFWREWKRENAARLDPAEVRRVTRVYLDSGDAGLLEQVTAAGGLALADLMPAVFGKHSERRNRAMRAAHSCANKPATWSATDDPRQQTERIRRWKSWWRRVELRFIEPSQTQKIVHFFTNTQFGVWMGQFITLDFGISTRDNRPVIDILKERIPVTIQLNVLAIFLTYLLAIPLGIFSATHQDSRMDKTLMLVLFLLYSVPVFWLAQMMILTMTGGPGWPNWFPSRGLSSEGAGDWPFWRWLLDRCWHLILPVVAQTVVTLAFLSRQMRVAMLEVIRQDFIRTARAKGLRERTVIYKHAVRNSLIPIITLAADLLPALIGGSIIVESIFSLNGMGKMTFEAILNRNYPVINCVFAFSALLTLVGILLADIGYALVDPRIRYD